MSTKYLHSLHAVNNMSKREAMKQPTSVFKRSKGLKVVKKRARRACRKRMQGKMRKLGDPKHQQSCHSAEQPKNDNASSFKAMKRPEWEALVKFVVYLEEMLEKYMDKAVMDGIREAAKATNFCTFPVPDGYEGKGPKYFSALASGNRVFLRCHTDQDFFYSIVISLSPGGDKEKVLNQFVFPTYGRTVTLRHLDVLIFNARDYHCVSTSCVQDDVLCSSLYRTEVRRRSLQGSRS